MNTLKRSIGLIMVCIPLMLSAQMSQDLYDKAIAGDSEAQIQLGIHYMLQHNNDQAVYWINKSLDQNNPKAQWVIGNIRYSQQKYDEAFQWYEKSALQNFAPGCNGLGKCYLEGGGTTRNLILAKKWFEEAVKLGDKESLRELNLVILEIKENEPFADKEVDEAYNQSISKEKKTYWGGWDKLEDLAENGHGKAYGYMGLYWLKEDEVQISVDDAKLGIDCFKHGAKFGDVISLCELGSYYSEGLTINGQCILEKNIVEAKRLLEIAASRNYHPACYNLGEIYDREGNKAMAEKWYLKAGEMGNVMAIWNLAMLYYNDNITTKAFQLFNLAENKIQEGKSKDLFKDNGGRFQNAIGNFYFLGIQPVQKDFTKALEWYQKAANNGNETAKIRIREISSQ